MKNALSCKWSFYRYRYLLCRRDMYCCCLSSFLLYREKPTSSLFYYFYVKNGIFFIIILESSRSQWIFFLMGPLKWNTSLPRRKARAKKTQQPKILGSRTKRSHTPPVTTLRRRGPQIQNNAPQRNEDSKGTRLPNPKFLFLLLLNTLVIISC